mmetsp:Transcript_24183/g.83966  ORF Transcript_24183/g.83966 Transcript_24183/m.83966 type:complete len:234 (-) Transcript_24183:1429-2130(-)
MLAAYTGAAVLVMGPSFYPAAILVLNLMFYTSYDKGAKAFRAAPLLDVLTWRNGVGWTLDQWNKILALGGFALVALPFVPGAGFVIDPISLATHAVMWQGVYMLWAHSAYSFFRYYNTTKYPGFSKWMRLSVVSDLGSSNSKAKLEAMKIVAITAGYVAHTVVFAWLLGYSAMSELTIVAVITSASVHFIFMESSAQWVLGVRPFGYLPQMLATTAVFYSIWSMPAAKALTGR